VTSVLLHRDCLQILDRTVSIHTMKGEEMDQCLLEEVVPYRQFTAQEIDLLAAMSGMEVSNCQPAAHSLACVWLVGVQL